LCADLRPPPAGTSALTTTFGDPHLGFAAAAPAVAGGSGLLDERKSIHDDYADSLDRWINLPP